jgi:hypothetical protein
MAQVYSHQLEDICGQQGKEFVYLLNNNFQSDINEFRTSYQLLFKKN